MKQRNTLIDFNSAYMTFSLNLSLSVFELFGMRVCSFAHNNPPNVVIILH